MFNFLKVSKYTYILQYEIARKITKFYHVRKNSLSYNVLSTVEYILISSNFSLRNYETSQNSQNTIRHSEMLSDRRNERFLLKVTSRDRAQQYRPTLPNGLLIFSLLYFIHIIHIGTFNIRGRRKMIRKGGEAKRESESGVAKLGSESGIINKTVPRKPHRI